MSLAGSVSYLIPGIRIKDEAAIQKLWDRYFMKLVRLARRKLPMNRGRVADELDAAACALESFCRRAERGEFPDLCDRGDLWSLLKRITLGKVADQIKRELTTKRGGGNVRGDSAFSQPGLVECEFGIAQSVIDREPTPAEASETADECARLLKMLRNDGLRQLALLKADGCTLEEIAIELGIGTRTAARWLAEIRKTWAKEVS